MHSTFTLICTLAFAGAPAVDSLCRQMAPAGDKWTRSPDQKRAVLLVHGYYPHFSDKNVPKASLRPWQLADSPLVKELGKNADVFAFGYGQNAPLDTLVKDSKLAANVAELGKLGYSEIVLVGHSAGGLIARQFVEDHPDAGVTKVIQVCAPNAGSPLADLAGARSQRAFLDCLTIDGRKKCLEARAAKRIPAKVQFACLLARADKDADTDGVVPCASQWSTDLQKQGIPVVCVIGVHRATVRDAKLAETLVGLVREPQPRWSAERVEAARKDIFGK
jgi:pimeloyl-ACP methyl ester carboxylesterase